MLFLLTNLVLFIGSSLLTYSALINIKLFATLPFGLEVLIILGLVTPLMNLYDTINNFVRIISIITEEDKDED